MIDPAIFGALVHYRVCRLIAPIWDFIRSGWHAVIFGLLATAVFVWAFSLAADRYRGDLVRWPPFNEIARASQPIEKAAQQPTSMWEAGKFRQILGIYLLFVILWQLRNDANRVVIEEFVDFTVDPGKKTASGLSTLLAAQLARMRDLYDDVDENRAAGIQTASHSAINATIKVDDISSSLTAVSAEATISLGPIKVPVGWLLVLLGSLLRTARISASVHDDNGALTLVAQYSSRVNSYTWRVYSPNWLTPPKPLTRKETPAPQAPAANKTRSIHDMIEELACRIFTDLALSGTVRWRAAWSFTCGLQQYRDCLRSQRNRVLKLREAENKFIETLSDDTKFGLAFYNLGVVYTELEQYDAGTAAFAEAVRQIPDHWAPAYALALSYFQQACNTSPDHAKQSQRLKKILETAKTPLPSREQEIPDLAKQTLRLEEIVVLCDRALALRAPSEAKAQILDLQGLVNRNLAESETDPTKCVEYWEASLARHTQATHYSVLAIGRAMLRPDAKSDSGAERLRHRSQLAAQCLRNLADTRSRRARMRNDENVADGEATRTLLRQAIILDPSNGDLHCDLGRLNHAEGLRPDALQSYKQAVAMAPKRADFLLYLSAISDTVDSRACANPAWNQFLDLASSLVDGKKYVNRTRFVDRTKLLSLSEEIEWLCGKQSAVGARLDEVIRVLYTLDTDSLPSSTVDNANPASHLGYLEQLISSLRLTPETWQRGVLTIRIADQYLKRDAYEPACIALEAAIESMSSAFPQHLLRHDVRTKLALARAFMALVGPTELINPQATAEMNRTIRDLGPSRILNPLNASTYNTIGGLDYTLTDTDHAQSTVMAGLLWAPEDYRMRLNIGSVQMMRADGMTSNPDQWKASMHDSIEKFEEILRIAPLTFLPQAHFMIGKQYFLLDEMDSAIAHLRVAKNLGFPSPGRLPVFACLQLCEALRAGGRLDEATLELTRFIASLKSREGSGEWQPRDTVQYAQHWASEPMYYEEVEIIAQVLLAHVHLDRAGDWGQAEHEFCKASDLMTSKQSNPNKDLRLSDDAVIRCSAACDGLEGRLRLVQGRIDEAIHKLNYALRLRQNAEHYLWLAMAYAKKLQSAAKPDPTLNERIILACKAVTRLDPAGRFKDATDPLLKPQEQGLKEPASEADTNPAAAAPASQKAHTI